MHSWQVPVSQAEYGDEQDHWSSVSPNLVDRPVEAVGFAKALRLRVTLCTAPRVKMTSYQVRKIQC
jgi:hypothetical protein